MERMNIIGWVLVLLTVAACGVTPTPPPNTAAVPTAQPGTAATTDGATTPSRTTTAEPTVSPTTTSSTDDNITPAAVHTVAAGEVVKLAGDSFATGDSDRFIVATTLHITWNYTGTASFGLWLVNVSDNVTDPQFDRILVNDVSGPHAGSATTKIIAGDWTVQVEQADGPWTVEFESVS